MLSRAAYSTSRRLVPALGSVGSRQKHKLPDLPYDYGALEPHINAQIMELHYSKHHAAYVNNLNVTEEKYLDALQKGKKIELKPKETLNFRKVLVNGMMLQPAEPPGQGNRKVFFKADTQISITI